MLCQKHHRKNIVYDEKETGDFKCPPEINQCYKWVAGVAVLSPKVPGVRLAGSPYHDVTLLNALPWDYFMFYRQYWFYGFGCLFWVLQKKNSRDFPEACSWKLIILCITSLFSSANK